MDVTVSVYTAGGRKIATLLNRELGPGSHSLVWNGTDSNGREVRSRTYFYRVEAGLFNEARRMTLVR